MTTKPKAKAKAKNRGTPVYEPTRITRELVQLHATVGTPHNTIAGILGISKPTLYRHYRDELDTALARANATIGGALFNKAKNGDTTAMIFWLKTKAGWREVNRHEVTGSDNKPIEIIRTIVDVNGDHVPIPGLTSDDKHTAH